MHFKCCQFCLILFMIPLQKPPKVVFEVESFIDLNSIGNIFYILIVKNKNIKIN